MFLQQPAVAITDFILTLETIILAFIILNISVKSKLKGVSFLFYISLALGSLIGGIVHGFFPDIGSFWNLILWKITMISIGLVALFAWLIAGNLVLPKYNKLILYVASLEFIFYCIFVLFVDSQFKIAILNYFPAIIFLFISFGILCFRKNYSSLWGLAGIILTFVAVWIQEAQISLHSIYFNHNALYHLVQGIALLLIFFALKRIISKKIKS
ncbi:MAG: hypothetical protein AABX35_02945 [Nanoarchaeota archaeon]